MVLDLLLAVIAIALWMIVLKLRRLLPGSSRKVIEAEEFVVRDPMGRRLARFGWSGPPTERYADLQFFDSSDKITVHLGSAINLFNLGQGQRTIGPSLSFQAGMGQRGGLTLGFDEYGCPVVRLSGQTSREITDKPLDPTQINLRINPDGSPAVRLFDRSGAVRGFLGLVPSETPEQLAKVSPELANKFGGSEKFAQAMSFSREFFWSNVTPGWSIVLFGDRDENGRAVVTWKAP